MNDEQRGLAFFQAQPEGPGLFFCPAALYPEGTSSLAYVAQLHGARSALLDKKTGPAVSLYSLRTPPRLA
ncbi:MAG: hypothetical protein COC05_04120 [Gammaproteobacteria bacterium]|nr:MAG: hypothetical protein COC05_04120 [Gammaproteobacteria bacterium]